MEVLKKQGLILKDVYFCIVYSKSNEIYVGYISIGTATYNGNRNQNEKLSLMV